MLDPYLYVAPAVARRHASPLRGRPHDRVFLAGRRVILAGRYIRRRRPTDPPDLLTALGDGAAQLGAAALDYVRPQYWKPREYGFTERDVLVTRGLHGATGTLAQAVLAEGGLLVVTDLPLFRWLETAKGDRYVSVSSFVTAALDDPAATTARTSHTYLDALGETVPVPRALRPGHALADDAPVLVLLQVPGDTAHGVTQAEYPAAVERLLTHTRRAGRPVVVRRHPNYPTVQLPPTDGVRVASAAESLDEALAGCAWCVTWNSSAAFAAIRRGVPVACTAYGDNPAEPPAWAVQVERFVQAAATHARLRALGDPVMAAHALHTALAGPAQRDVTPEPNASSSPTARGVLPAPSESPAGRPGGEATPPAPPTRARTRRARGTTTDSDRADA